MAARWSHSVAEGDGGLDAIGDFVITGGTVVIGGNSVAAPSGESTQPSLYVVCGSTQATGTLATVAREGKEILAITPDKEFRSIFVSSGDLVVGGVYEVYVGGTAGASTSVTAAIAPAGTGAMDMPADAADAGIPATGSATTVPAAE